MSSFRGTINRNGNGATTPTIHKMQSEEPPTPTTRSWNGRQSLCCRKTTESQSAFAQSSTTKMPRWGSESESVSEWVSEWQQNSENAQNEPTWSTSKMTTCWSSLESVLTNCNMRCVTTSVTQKPVSLLAHILMHHAIVTNCNTIRCSMHLRSTIQIVKRVVSSKNQ